MQVLSVKRYHVLILIRHSLLFGLLVITTAVAAIGSEVSPSVSPVSLDPYGRFHCDASVAAHGRVTIVSTVLGGVPALLRIPVRIMRPPIVLWHGFGPPASGRALMESMPLDDVPAVKVYPELPLFGTRAPKGGNAELARRQATDFAMLLFKPAVVGAADELPAMLISLQQRGCMKKDDAIGLFGFSAGGAAVLSVLEQDKVAVHAAVLVNASTGFGTSVQALARITGKPYLWNTASRDLAVATDADDQAEQLARGSPPKALLIVQGEDDTVLTTAPALALHASLQRQYPPGEGGRLQLMLMPGVPHGWSGDKQAVAALRRATAQWFNHYR